MKIAKQQHPDLVPADGKSDEAWQRMHGSGTAGTSQADSLKLTDKGRRRLAEMRESLKRAQTRKAQVRGPPVSCALQF